MKKFGKYLLLTLAVLPLFACGADDPTSSNGEQTFEADKVKIYFFESSVKCDRRNPLAIQEIVLGDKIADPNLTPVSTDSAFTTFLGWSHKPIIMSDDDFWNFDEDHIPSYIPNLEFALYGQWSFEEAE